MDKILFSFGHGYSAQALARLLLPRGWRIWGSYLVMGALNNAIPFTLISFHYSIQITTAAAASAGSAQLCTMRAPSRIAWVSSLSNISGGNSNLRCSA